MQDDRVFAEILEKCLEATSTGQASVADCVARYPEHAAPLEEFLVLSDRVRALPLPAPTPEMLAAGERRLLQAVRAKGPGRRGGCLRSAWAWLAAGAAAALSCLCLLVCLIAIVIVIIKPCYPHPTPTPTPKPELTATLTVTPTWTPTASPTATATATGTATPAVTPAETATETPTPTSTATAVPPPATPSPTDTPIPPTPTPIPPTATRVPAAPTPADEPNPSLGFHPDELRAEGCATSYRATGSLKNHGGQEANWAANVQIGHQVVKGAEYVSRVTVSPDFWPAIGGSETVGYTIKVDTRAPWQGQNGKEIKVRLYIAREDNRPGHHQTQAHLTIVNLCP